MIKILLAGQSQTVPFYIKNVEPIAKIDLVTVKSTYINFPCRPPLYDSICEQLRLFLSFLYTEVLGEQFEKLSTPPPLPS